MSFQYHYHEVLDTIGGMFTEMFKGLRDNFAKEIEAVCQQYPMEPFKFLDPPLRLEYAEGVAMLKQAGNVSLWLRLNYYTAKIEKIKILGAVLELPARQ